MNSKGLISQKHLEQDALPTPALKQRPSGNIYTFEIKYNKANVMLPAVQRDRREAGCFYVGTSLIYIEKFQTKIVKKKMLGDNKFNVMPCNLAYCILKFNLI